jgi:hypothetical protein
MLADALRALRYRDFRLLWIGLGISAVGTWMHIVAQSLLVLEITHGSALALGTVSLAQASSFLMYVSHPGNICRPPPRSAARVCGNYHLRCGPSTFPWLFLYVTRPGWISSGLWCCRQLTYVLRSHYFHVADHITGGEKFENPVWQSICEFDQLHVCSEVDSPLEMFSLLTDRIPRSVRVGAEVRIKG